jgi:hypothetical protein
LTGGRVYRWRSLRLISTIAVVLAMGMVAAVSGASAANAKCDPHRANDGKNYWSGWERLPGATVGGVYSDIYNYSPWVHSSTGVVAWAMLNNGNGAWAQMGWLEYPGGDRRTFVQWTKSGDFFEEHYVAQPVNTFTTYTVLWNNTPGKFTFRVNGSTIDTEDAGFAPNEGQLYGEIHSLWDQMPGALNNHENFYNSHIYFGTNGWHNFNGSNHNTGSNYFGNSRHNDTDTDIWDKACSS